MKEVLAMQIIRIMENVFTEANIDIILRPYDILCTGAREGLVECINEGMSIDQIKKTILKSRAEHRGDKGTDTHITYPKIESLNVPQSNFKFDSQHRNVGMTGVAGQSEGQVSMKEIFEIYFGASYSPLYGVALQNFVKSLAGYSLVTYLLQVCMRMCLCGYNSSVWFVLGICCCSFSFTPSHTYIIIIIH
jgi:phosphatidylinositol kinase/protein kinase (PI-3  family)